MDVVQVGLYGSEISVRFGSHVDWRRGFPVVPVSIKRGRERDRVAPRSLGGLPCRGRQGSRDSVVSTRLVQFAQYVTIKAGFPRRSMRTGKRGEGGAGIVSRI